MATCFCIIVSYRPDVARLAELCSRLIVEGAAVIVVDNTERPSFEPSRMPEGCTLIQLGHNSGIAHAQNVGVRAALLARAEILLFFNQNSKVEAGFVASLASALDPSVAEVVAPLCVDEATGMPLAAEDLGRFGWSKGVYWPRGQARYRIDISISSGMAVTRRAVESVGPFDEDYFIDFVDSDWCLRCRDETGSDLCGPWRGLAAHHRQPAFQCGPSRHLGSRATALLLPDQELLSSLSKASHSILVFVETIAGDTGEPRRSDALR